MLERKRFSQILSVVFALVFSMVSVHAEEPENVDTDVFEINELYAGEIPEEELTRSPEKKRDDGEKAGRINGGLQEFYHAEDASAMMRQRLKERAETFSFLYHISKEDYDSSAEAFRDLTRMLWDEALEHTGVPDEGDYLKWQWGNWRASRTTEEEPSSYAVAITYTVTYFTTAEQEAETDAAIDSILDSFAMPANITQHDKIEQIYDWVTTHISYVNDGTLYCHSCHSAVVSGQSVCQGYALAFYRLALSLGIDCRLIGGTVGTENHGWNIVYLDGWYYNVDPTWDGMYREGAKLWFLKGSKNFTSRVRWGSDRRYDYDSPEFHAKYPTDEEDYDRTKINAIHQFIQAMYENCLGREPEKDGYYNWSGYLWNGKTAADVVNGFFRSAEFQNRNTDDDAFTEICYRVFLNRPSDPAGKNSWMKAMADGCSRNYVLRGFLRSDEFLSICQKAQISRGDIVLTEPRDKYPNISAFVSRLYTKALNRSFDPAGLNDWVRHIASKTITAREAAVNGFLNSPEFRQRKLSDTEYIRTLYRVFMDREGEEAGVRYWEKKLAGGMTRQKAAEGFADSAEFAEILNTFGI